MAIFKKMSPFKVKLFKELWSWNLLTSCTTRRGECEQPLYTVKPQDLEIMPGICLLQILSTTISILAEISPVIPVALFAGFSLVSHTIQ